MKTTLALAACLALGAASAFAAEGTGEGPPADAAKRWAACQSEIQKFCATIEPGEGRGKIRSCLEGHSSELSDGCKARMAEHPHKG